MQDGFFYFVKQRIFAAYLIEIEFYEY